MGGSSVDYDTIRVERDGRVEIVTLDRPEKLNAWSWTLGAEMVAAFDAADADDDVRAIVVTGAGRVFCAGADLGDAGNTFTGKSKVLGGPDAMETVLTATPASMRSTPIIAAINGAAVGAGLTMTVDWDIRIAADDAKLGFVFNRRGIMPDADIIWIVPRLIGLSRALDILLTGRIFTGAEGAEMGLVARAVPRERVLETALEAAHDIARNVAPVSAAITKRLARRFLEMERPEAAQLQRQLFAWTGSQPDAVEGVVSFLQKREPNWKMSKTRDLPDGLD
jgi:enoyl-CoA hydratase/carnithine racemase